MMTFDRFILAIIGAAATTVILLAAELPINRTTHAPKAVFFSPDAVPEITSLEKSRRKSLTSNTLFRMFARIKYDFNSVQAASGGGNTGSSLYKSGKKLVIKTKKLEEKNKIEKAESLYLKALDKLEKAYAKDKKNADILNYL